jgi:thioredoxin reductase
MLAQRVIEHPSITVRWNTVLVEVLVKVVSDDQVEQDDSQDVDLDAPVTKVVSGAILKDIYTGVESKIDADAVFVAIGHTPSTSFLEGLVEFNPKHPGYVLTQGSSTRRQNREYLHVDMFLIAFTVKQSPVLGVVPRQHWMPSDG